MKEFFQNKIKETAIEHANAMCGYRKFKLFIPGEDVIQFLIANAETFSLKGMYDVWDNKQYALPLKGYWGDKYKMRVTAGKIKNLGVGVELMGDFKHFYYEGNDPNIFIWKEFVETVQRLVAIFPTVAEKIHVINLTPSVKLQIPVDWGITAPELMMQIFRYKGKYNHMHDSDRFEKGYQLQFALSEYVYHIKTDEEDDSDTNLQSMRIEMEIKKSDYLKDRGITFLSDLLLYENHKLLFNQLTENLDHLVIYQNGIDNELLLVEKGIYCREYNVPHAWNKLHNKSTDEYKYCKASLEKVIERVCLISYKKELQKLATDTVKEIVYKEDTEAVPDFPLYIEKQEIFYTIIPVAAVSYSYQ
jgi:hypothetical protein